MPSELPSKTCIQCGRSFAWRKKWALSWAQVQYCSKGCRGRGPQDPAQVQALLALLRASPKGTLELNAATEVRLSCEREALRACARLLVEQGRAQLYAGGRRVSPAEAKGRLVLRLR